MTDSERGRGPSSVGRRVYRRAMNLGPGDLILIGAGLLIAGFVSISGILGTSGVILALGNFLFTGGILAFVFGIPWLLLNRILS